MMGISQKLFWSHLSQMNYVMKNYQTLEVKLELIKFEKLSMKWTNQTNDQISENLT